MSSLQKRQPSRSRVVSSSIIDRTDPLMFSSEVMRQIERTIGRLPAEAGGMLGTDRASGVITEFAFDASAATTGSTYSPDLEFVNRLLKENWNPRGIRLAGFVHSHPDGFDRPSAGDLHYVQQAQKAMPTLREFALPIVQPKRRGTDQFIVGYAVHRRAAGSELRQRPVRIVEAVRWNQSHFSRVSDQAVDLELLSRCRIVAVGTGGSASFCEDMARAGVGQVVLIDPDRIEPSNVGTQRVRPREIGALKVRELASGLHATSDHVQTLGIAAPVEALLDDMDRLLFGSLPGLTAGPPDVTLLCGFTDSFEAQALVNRVALQFGVPMLAAQVYERGVGLELSLTAPGVTPACGRCVLSPRYRALLAGVSADVGSSGTPYAATAMLNAFKQDIALALLQGTVSERLDDTRRDAAHPARRRASDLLSRIGERNLVQIRRSPLIAQEIGLSSFDRALCGADLDRFAFGEPIWLRQQPDHPRNGFDRCPDCGGVGELGRVAGTFSADELRETAAVLSARRAAVLDGVEIGRAPVQSGALIRRPRTTNSEEVTT